MEREHGALQTVPEGLSISVLLTVPTTPLALPPFAGLFSLPLFKWCSLRAPLSSFSPHPHLWHKRMSPSVPLHLLYWSETPERGGAWVSLALLKNMAFCSVRAKGDAGYDFGEVPGLSLECEDLSHSPRSVVCSTSFHQQEAVVPSGFFFLGGGGWGWGMGEDVGRKRGAASAAVV